MVSVALKDLQKLLLLMFARTVPIPAGAFEQEKMQLLGVQNIANGMQLCVRQGGVCRNFLKMGNVQMRVAHHGFCDANERASHSGGFL